MTDATNRPAEDIERELERKRAKIDRTTEAIQDRLTPEAAFDHALAYMRGSGGQRLLATDQGEYGLLDVRKIELEGIDDTGPGDGAGDATDGGGASV